MAKITLRNICKQYEKGIKAVDNFNLEVEDGEFIVLLGPHGAGKSVVLNIVAGLEKADAGELYFGDRMVNNVAAKDRDVALLFQNVALYPHMTVYENMAFAVATRGFSREEIRFRVEDAAALLDISHLLDRRPKALSSGQRQRVTLGRAVVRRPQIFLLDEPLSNLDDKLRAQMRTELSKLHMRLRATFLYVTNDQVEAVSMGDRIVLMKEGRIQQVGRATQLYTQPRNVFVASAVGAPPINLIEAELYREGDGLLVAFGFGEERCALCLPREKAAAVRGAAGKSVLLGLRPESFRDEPHLCGQPGFSAVQGRVQAVQAASGGVFAELDCAGVRLVVSTSAQPCARLGEILRLSVDMRQAHLFNRVTQEAL